MPATQALPTASCPPDTWSEAELLRRTLAREDRAWRELVRRYRPLLIRCIAQITSRYAPHFGPSEIDEIYAEVLLKLYRDDMRRLRGFDVSRGTKLGSWLGTIAMRAAYDSLRSAGRRPLAGLDPSVLEEASDRTPLDALLEKERWGCLGELLGELTPRDRRFLELYFDEGLEPAAVAGEMAINLKTVYTKKHKIRAHLRRSVATRAADYPLADLEELAA
jgi:RNA polymerase sigma-70 factor, ECF subfamily